jgi:dTDP-4-dehydrorhamnose reductase
VNHTRFLIIGASGRVGTRLHRTLGPEYAVATYRASAFPGGVHFDSTRMRLRDTLLPEDSRYTHAFLLQGVTNIDACARDPQGTAAVNVDSMRHVIDDLLESGIVPVFASSDAVYDGAKGRLTEEDPAAPILTYGRQKLEIERYLLERSKEAIVVRLAKVVGTGDPQSDMLEGWLGMLDAGREIACASDQIFTPIHAHDAARALVDLAKGSHRGLFNAGGPKVVECRLNDLPFSEPRPLDASMDSGKLYRALGWQPTTMHEACRRAALEHYRPAERAASA